MSQNYVLGFAFDHINRVALIRKVKPEWQAGHWNGIGGKVEGFDSSNSAAMEREFKEETGVMIPAQQWREFGVMHSAGRFKVHLFTVQCQQVRNVRTTTEEKVALFYTDVFSWHPYPTIENVPWLIELCLMRPSIKSNAFPYVNIEYPAEAS